MWTALLIVQEKTCFPLCCSVSASFPYFYSPRITLHDLHNPWCFYLHEDEHIFRHKTSSFYIKSQLSCDSNKYFC